MPTPTETPQGLAARMATVQVIDVREPDEWSAGHIDGAVHVPLNTLLAGGGAPLDPARPAVMVCRSGARSELATLMLMTRGFDAANLVGGMEAWARAGLPVTTDAGTHNARAVIIATGSELQLALGAAKKLAEEGIAVRVVSMPSSTVS